MRYQLGLLLSLFTFVPALQAARWEPLPLWGGEVQVAAPEGGSLIAYAATPRAGIYRTDDGGATWQFSGPGPGWFGVEILGVDPQAPRRLYAAGQDYNGGYLGLFQSADGGRRWRRSDTGLSLQGLPLHVAGIAFHPRQPGWLYAATEAGLYLSRDRAASWSLLALPDVVLGAVAVAPHAPETLLVTTWDGVNLKMQRSVDGGRTFVEVPDEGPRQIVFDPTRPRRVYGFTLGYAFYRSDDLGATWTRSFPASLQSLAVTRTGILVAGTFDVGMQRSLDGGTTWLPRPEEVPIRRPVDGITSIAVLRDRVLAGGSRGIWRGSAEGLGWQAASDGVLAQTIGPLAVAADSTVWVGVPRGFFLSGNGGGTFKSHGTALGPQAFLDRLAVHPREPQIAYARGCCIEGDGGVLRTDDGGRHWRRLPYNGVTRDFWVLEVDPEDPDVVYAGGFWGPHNSPCTANRSSDGGATWTCMTPPGVLDFLDLTFDPEDSRILYALFGPGRLYRSENRGASWTPLFKGQGGTPEIVQIEADPGQPGRLYGRAHAYGLIYRSDNGGRTWSRKKLGLPKLSEAYDLLVDPARPGRLYVALSVYSPAALKSRGQVFRSDDAGEHWVKMSDGLPGGIVTDLATDPRGGDILYAGTYGQGLYRIRVEE